MTIELLNKLRTLTKVDIDNFVEDLPDLLNFVVSESVEVFNEVYENIDLVDDYISYAVEELADSIMTWSEEELVRNFTKVGYYTILAKKGTQKKIKIDDFMKVASPKTLKKIMGTKNITKTLEIVSSAKHLGIKSVDGLKGYSKLHDTLKTMPFELSVKKIREGASLNKIAIVGRNMTNVKKTAQQIKQKTGLDVEFFSDNKAWSLFRERVRKYNDTNNILPRNTYIPYKEVKKTKMYKSNIKWAKKLKKEGYTVLDIGRPNKALDKSAFYDIEQKILFED